MSVDELVQNTIMSVSKISHAIAECCDKKYVKLTYITSADRLKHDSV